MNELTRDGLLSIKKKYIGNLLVNLSQQFQPGNHNLKYQL